MKKVTIQPKATIVAQVQAGTSVSAVIDSAGVLFLPIMDINSIIVNSGAEAPTMKEVVAKKKATPKAVESEEAPKAATVLSVLTDVDEGTTEESDAVAELMKVVDFPKEFVTEMFDKFMDNPDTPIEDLAKELEAGPKTKAKKKAAPKKKAEAKKEEAVAEEVTLTVGEVVTIDELQVGHKVNVFWKEYDDTYSGVVESIVKGKRNVKYDEDGEIEVLDVSEHTKITFLGAN